MIKELSTISLRNPLEMSKNNEIFGGSSNSQATIKDFSKFFMNVYEYFNSMQLGLPISTVISNYLVDLKVCK
jgi:predicted component of type VI protein secretion system